jgi:hypothetical protein
MDYEVVVIIGISTMRDDISDKYRPRHSADEVLGRVIRRHS